MPAKLPNYLLMHRKRSGLSQTEAALLMGTQSRSRISRYERRGRLPTLEAALALELIYGVPVRELFAGVYERVEHLTRRQMRILARNLSTEPKTASAMRKLAWLEATHGSARGRGKLHAE